MSTFLFVFGFLLMIVAAAMIIVTAFQESVFWGLLCLVVPFCQLIFIATHWQETKSAVFIYLAGIALFALAVMTSPQTPEDDDESWMIPVITESAQGLTALSCAPERDS